MKFENDGLLTQIVTYLAYNSALGRGRVEEEMDFLRRKSGMKPEEFDALVGEMRRRAETVRDELGTRLAESLRGSTAPLMKILDLPTREDVDGLRREVADLREQLAQARAKDRV